MINLEEARKQIEPLQDKIMKISRRVILPPPNGWRVFCEKAGKIVKVEGVPLETTALALCSHCGQSVHNNNHKTIKGK